MSDTIYPELFVALDILAFERENETALKPLAAVPAWWQRLYPNQSGQSAYHIGSECPFLENFLIDAEQFWQTGQAGKISSGIWYEDDVLEGQIRIEAAAINVGDAHFLIIERADGHVQQDLLQKARESELRKLATLAAKEHEEELMRQTSQLLERLVEESTADLNKANEELRGEVEVRKRAEEQARQALVENEVLVKEVHHRVKNNLQIISSLIDLQINKIDDPKALEAFADNRNRIFTLALIHENLYDNKQLANIDFSTYVNGLIQMLNDVYNGDSRGIELTLELEQINLGIDAAVPCGLIVNEIVSNALKHAFAKGQTGILGLKLRYGQENEILLDIWDNGSGLPAEMNLEQPNTLGLRLIKTLTGQLGGKIELKDRDGTRFELRFHDRSKPIKA